MSTPEILLSGHCACNAIKYTSTSLPAQGSSICYCLTCRRLSGTQGLTFIDLPTSALTFSAPPKQLKLSSYAQRGFCGQCGTPLTMQYAIDKTAMGVAVGSIDEESIAPDRRSCLKPKQHIFLKDKPSWFEVPDDGAERHDAHAEAFQRLLDEAGAS